MSALSAPITNYLKLHQCSSYQVYTNNHGNRPSCQLLVGRSDFRIKFEWMKFNSKSFPTAGVLVGNGNQGIWMVLAMLCLSFCYNNYGGNDLKQHIQIKKICHHHPSAGQRYSLRVQLNMKKQQYFQYLLLHTQQKDVAQRTIKCRSFSS